MTDPTQAEKQYRDAVREGQQAIVDAAPALPGQPASDESPQEKTDA